LRLKAENHKDQGNFRKALQLYDKLYDMMRTKFGENHTSTIEARYSLAGALGSSGEYQKAEEHYRYFLEFGKLNPGNNQLTLNAMHNIGAMCDLQGKKEEALELFRRCWELRTIAMGPDHDETLSSMHSYAIVLTEMGRFEEAEGLLLECLARLRKGLGKEGRVERSTILKCLSSLSNCYCGQEKYNEAEKFARQGLDESRMLFSSSHPESHVHTFTLALILASNGKLDEAEALQKDCIEKRKLTLGDKHPLYFLSLGNLGAILSKGNRFDEAEAIWKQCSDRERKVLGESVHYFETMINLADIYDETGRRADAQKIYKESYYKLKEIAGETYPSVVLARSRLLNSYHEDGKIAERDEFFNAAGLRKLTGDESQAIITNLLQNIPIDTLEDLAKLKSGTVNPELLKLISMTGTKVLQSQKKG